MLKFVNDSLVSNHYYDTYYVHVMLKSNLKILYLVVVIDFYFFINLKSNLIIL